MKCTIPEISWHNREPILSVDIFPENRNFYRLASGGGDCHVLIWQMTISEIGAVNQEVISDLTRHQRAVNCVRWSNTGQHLASGDDDANIIIWQLKTDNIPLLEGDTGDREIWTVFKVMRGHKEDVYDLCWSMDGMKILSGSVDNTSILWDVPKGKMDHIMTDHKGFVQGVSWDPKNQILATISTDRICRIFDPFGKQIKARIHKGKLSVPDTHYLHDKEVKLFHDDTFKSFFRRLQFTPDGSLLIVPSGHIEADNCKHPLNATLIFSLDNFSSPAVILPLPHQSSTVVRCCPILYELHEDGPDPIIKLPYRMIFAVGTDHDIILYDTQQTVPFARFQDIHYTRLTDLTWSQDGLLLIASSTDGFCSLITFEMDELGVPWVKMDSEEQNQLNISGCEELVKDENVDTSNKDVVVEEKIKLKEEAKAESRKRPSFLEQWAIQKPKKRFNPEGNKRDAVMEILDFPEKKSPAEVSDGGKMNIANADQEKKDVPVNRLIPRRITPLKIEDSTKTEVDKNDLCLAKGKVNILIPKRIEPKPVPYTSEPSCSTQKHTKHIDITENGQLSEDDEDSADSEAEILSKDELEDFHKASENIREFYCRIPRKQVSSSDVKPIAVRRKSRDTQSNVSCEHSDGGSKADSTSISIANKHWDAKPIEVRRKPKDQQTSQKNQLDSGGKDHKPIQDAKLIEVRRKPRSQETSQKDEVKSEEKVVSLDYKPTEDAKHIEVRRKPRQGGFNLKPELKSEDKSVLAKDHLDAKSIVVNRKAKGNKEEKCTTENNKTEEKVCVKELQEPCKSDKEKTIAKETDKSSEDNICIIDSDNKKYNTTPRKPKLDKPNTLKKIVADGPPKIKVSSLVKQRKSAEKTPKKTNALLNFLQKSAEKKTKNPKRDKEVFIGLSLEENEARDAWKCDSREGKGQVMKSEKDGERTVPVDDDITEDFCLQLEDSQEGCDEEKTESQMTEECQAKINDEIKSVIGDKGLVGEIKVLSDMPKTPRRVALITLASPKGKVKK